MNLETTLRGRDGRLKGYARGVCWSCSWLGQSAVCLAPFFRPILILVVQLFGIWIMCIMCTEHPHGGLPPHIPLSSGWTPHPSPFQSIYSVKEGFVNTLYSILLWVLSLSYFFHTYTVLYHMQHLFQAASHSLITTSLVTLMFECMHYSCVLLLLMKCQTNKIKRYDSTGTSSVSWLFLMCALRQGPLTVGNGGELLNDGRTLFVYIGRTGPLGNITSKSSKEMPRWKRLQKTMKTISLEVEFQHRFMFLWMRKWVLFEVCVWGGGGEGGVLLL